MKICIYAQARSGSTSLYRLIREHLDMTYESYDEPFNDAAIKEFQTKDLLFLNDMKYKNNVLIKTLHYNTVDGLNDTEFFEKLLKAFDILIVLIRVDILSQTESYLYKLLSNASDWHEREYYDMNIISEEQLKDKLLDYSISNRDIINVCEKNNIKIYTYEDLYINKNKKNIKEMFDSLKLELNDELYNEWILNENKKERIT